MKNEYLFGVDEHLDKVGVATYQAYRLDDVNEEGILELFGNGVVELGCSVPA